MSFIDQMIIKRIFSLQKRLLKKIYKYFSVLKCYILSRFNFKLWYYKQVNKPFIFVKFMPELKEGGGEKISSKIISVKSVNIWSSLEIYSNLQSDFHAQSESRFFWTDSSALLITCEKSPVMEFRYLFQVLWKETVLRKWAVTLWAFFAP